MALARAQPMEGGLEEAQDGLGAPWPEAEAGDG
jgi:hypothetical protein